MRKQPIKFDGPTMNTLTLLPCKDGSFPSWSDVYVDGKLLFQNVFVLRQSDSCLYLYRSYRQENGSAPVNPKPEYLVAVVHSNNYVITARKTQ